MTTFRINGADAGAITRGIGALSDAFFPNPGREAQARFYASGARHNAARAADQELVTSGRRDMAASVRAGADVMPATPAFYLSHAANPPGADRRQPAGVNA